MVTSTPAKARPPWQDAQFIGGHPVLDLTNAVFDRAHPTEDGELLETPSDVLTWCASAGLFDRVPPLAEADGLVAEVQAVREQAWAVFSAVARDSAVPAEAFGALLERAGTGVRAGYVQRPDSPLDHFTADWTAPAAIPAVLALLAVHALYTLPPDRIRECGRCGWLFLDSSRGGRRRWCSMSTCGNREKASRHRRTRTRR
ncbi:CGNR zinc finger domain-containing protein [Actinomadura sp. 7K507]|uniref:CGNR zinc finger domain-containing protein n=1 Tax=Actinomadura sp. 7K507 TaxID=2530365 RepID=UPI00104BF087|nr:CGNR zinc finger domain-containing protein [Actinomadura sp. 7K507]TDC91350.1 zf-CGNR multi-domain protein [Actinomadura sp. 7K507]